MISSASEITTTSIKAEVEIPVMSVSEETSTETASELVRDRRERD